MPCQQTERSMSVIEPILRDGWRTPVSSDDKLAGGSKGLVMGKPVQPKGTAIIISTRGRPDIVNALVRQIGEQSRPPQHIFVIASKAEDIAGLDQNRDDLTLNIGRTGS